MTDEDNSEHGQTYGEAVDDVLERSITAIEGMYETAEERRENGHPHQARLIESIANDLAKDVIELAEKRKRMPFGIESARGFGETMQNPTLSFLEETQREDTDE